MIVAPPSLAGAAKLTVTLEFPRVAVTIPGASGTVAGVTGVTLPDAADAAPVPTLLVAVTVNTYTVPFVRPLTVIGLEEPVPVSPPGLEVPV